MTDMTERLLIPYKPRPQFTALHDRSERWMVAVCHRRAGKTVALINELVRAAVTCERSDPRYAYCAPFYAQAKDVAWTYLKKYAGAVPGVTFNESELRCDFAHNGARIRLYGLDNYDRMRGTYLDGVVLDEYGDADPRAWAEVMRPQLADRHGWAAFIGTPNGPNHFYEIWKAAESDPDWLRLMLKASETGLIEREELIDAARVMTRDQYDQEFECSFHAAVVGAFWGVEMREAEEAGRICRVECDPALPVHTAWDLGRTDDTAIWFYQVVRGEIHVIDFYSISGGSIESLAGVVADRGYKYGFHHLPHDARAKTLAAPGGKSIIEQLSVFFGWSAMRIVPSLSIQDGIQAVRMVLPVTWFDRDKCKLGIEALMQYQREYDGERKAFRATPRHDWTSHPADAFRMLAVAYDHEPKVRRPDPERSLVVGPMNQATLDDMWAAAKRENRAARI